MFLHAISINIAIGCSLADNPFQWEIKVATCRGNDWTFRRVARRLVHQLGRWAAIEQLPHGICECLIISRFRSAQVQAALFVMNYWKRATFSGRYVFDLMIITRGRGSWFPQFHPIRVAASSSSSQHIIIVLVVVQIQNPHDFWSACLPGQQRVIANNRATTTRLLSL